MSQSRLLSLGFKDVVADPLAGTPASDIYSNVCTAGNLAANTTTYIIYSLLIIFIISNLAMGIYKVMTSEDKETFVKLQAALTNAVLAAFGMAIIMGVLFIPVTALRFVGIQDADNIFLKNCQAPRPGP